LDGRLVLRREQLTPLRPLPKTAAGGTQLEAKPSLRDEMMAAPGATVDPKRAGS
jgi:hypothetical protein